MFNKLCLIGTGLIAGSVARAVRKNTLCQEIVAYGQDEHLDNLEQAKQLGVIDRYYTDYHRALSGADCVLIGTPVGTMPQIFAELKPFWEPKTVYTDVGSTKNSVVSAIKQVFGCMPANFVPAHPIAGKEKSGAAAAEHDLFVDKKVIITPLPETRDDALRFVSDLWQAIGASVTTMDVVHHDKVLAATSHLPHVIAFALVELLGQKDEQEEIFKYAAGGFKDFTRIASSDPQMWVDICRANRQQIIPLIEELQAELQLMAGLLEQQSEQRIFEKFSYAKNARQRFLEQFK